MPASERLCDQRLRSSPTIGESVLSIRNLTDGVAAPWGSGRLVQRHGEEMAMHFRARKPLVGELCARQAALSSRVAGATASRSKRSIGEALPNVAPVPDRSWVALHRVAHACHIRVPNPAAVGDSRCVCRRAVGHTAEPEKTAMVADDAGLPDSPCEPWRLLMDPALGVAVGDVQAQSRPPEDTHSDQQGDDEYLDADRTAAHIMPPANRPLSLHLATPGELPVDHPFVRHGAAIIALLTIGRNGPATALPD